MRIGGLLDRPWKKSDGRDDDDDNDDWRAERRKLEMMELRIQELDLAHGMLERWEDVGGICSALSHLKRLRLR